MKIAVLPCILALLVSISPVSALDIVLVEDAASSPPASDPGGDQLEAILEAAAAVWEEIIEDPGTITITWGWDSLPGGLTRGRNLTSTTPWTGEIHFDNDPATSWFFDPTPEDHSEFNLNRTVLNSLTPSDQTLRFGGTPPPALEVSYSGSATAAEAMDAFDALAFALYEIGHALGMSSTTATDAETADGDYDVPAALGGGSGFEINVSAASDYDLEPDAGTFNTPLMCDCENSGQRRLPTQTDVLALASALYSAGGVGNTMYWTELDMPRKTWNGSGVQVWETAGAWIGEAVPGSDDAVFVSNGTNVRVTQRNEINELTISGLSTDVTVEEILHAEKIVAASADLRLDDALVTTSVLELQAGIGANTVLGGGGTVEFETLIDNSGIILAGGNATGDPVLMLVGDEGASIDYDGASETGSIKAEIGDLEFTGTQADDFDGIMLVGAGRMMTFFETFTLGSDGQMFLTGGAAPANAAVIEGNSINLSGEVTVDGECLFANFSTFLFDGAVVDLTDAESRLSLENGALMVPGARVTGPGRLASRTELFLVQNTEIEAQLQVAGTLTLQRTTNSTAATASIGALDLSAADSVALAVGSTDDDALTDLIAVTGHAELGGELLVGFGATGALPGQRWTVMTYGSANGRFSDVEGLDLPAGMRLTPLFFNDRVEVVLQEHQDYELWATLHPWPQPDQSQGNDDPDCDGWPNRFEFLADSDPLSPSSAPVLRLTTTRIGGDEFLTIQFGTPLGIVKTGYELIAERSTDLASWTENGVVPTSAVVRNSGVLGLGFRLTVTMGNGAKQFLRLDALGDGR